MDVLLLVFPKEYLAGFADVGGDGGQIWGGSIIGNCDRFFSKPTQSQGEGLFDPSDTHIHITLQVSGIHFFSAFGTVHFYRSFQS